MKRGQIDDRGKLAQSTRGLPAHLSGKVHDKKGAQESLMELEGALCPEAKKRKVQQTLAQFSALPLMTSKEREKQQELKTVKFICGNWLRFSIVESDSFCKLVKDHNPSAAIMSARKKVKKNIALIDSLMRERMTEELEGKAISATVDHWTSKANQTFTGLTAHWIDDDWVLQSHNLGLFPHSGRSKGKELQEDFERLLLSKLRL